MEYLNPLNWFKKSEPTGVPQPAPAPVAPVTQAAGRRRRGSRRHAKKAGRRHRTRKH